MVLLPATEKRKFLQLLRKSTLYRLSTFFLIRMCNPIHEISKYLWLIKFNVEFNLLRRFSPLQIVFAILCDFLVTSRKPLKILLTSSRKNYGLQFTHLVTLDLYKSLNILIFTSCSLRAGLREREQASEHRQVQRIQLI
jgi:hypothetical protein